MSVTKSISNTLLRILPLMDSSGAQNGNGNEERTGQVRPSVDIHGDNQNDDATSLSSDSSCSSCVSSCPSFVNERKTLGPYRLVETLGIGEFGKIKLGIHTETEQKVAIKVIKKNNDAAMSNLTKVEREIQVLKSLRHPHIVKLIEVIETETRLGIILEYASGGELFEYVLSHSSLEENIARNIFAQLISSVNHMHMKGIVHRDLKLENLLFLDAQQTHIIVSDFGFANSDANNKDLLSTCCGSPTYAAPELVYPSGGYKGPAADVWSCGVILYCMVCGYLPFDDDPENPESANLHRLYQYIRSTNTPSFPGFVSDDAQDLIRKMLQHDPSKRCTVDTIINHPWLQAYRSTLFGMSTEQLEQQALDSIKRHHTVPLSASTNVDQLIQLNGYHRHHHQLSAIEENQHHQEEDEQQQHQEQENEHQNDDDFAPQPYKFLELNDHADNNPHDVDQVQIESSQDTNDQAQNDKDVESPQSKNMEKQYRDIMEPGTDYKPLELTQINNYTEQDQQQSVQNDEPEDVPPPPPSPPSDKQLNQDVTEEKKIDNQGLSPETLETNSSHQEPLKSIQEDQSSRNIETPLTTALPELAQNSNGLQESAQASNKLEQQLQATTTNELNEKEVPQVENEPKKLPPAPVKDQHCDVTPEKNQEQVHHITTPPDSAQEKALDQCSTQQQQQGETGLTNNSEHSQELSQSANGDQLEKGDDNNDEMLDTTISQHHSSSDQHEIPAEMETVGLPPPQIYYNEQPPQHPMDTQSPPITSLSIDNEAKTTNDNDLSFLSSIPTGENDAIFPDSGIKEQQRQRQPSLRRQKKFRPSIAEDEPLPTTIITNKPAANTQSVNTNASNTNASNTNASNTSASNINASNVNTVNAHSVNKNTSVTENAIKAESNHDENTKEFIGIRPSLLGKNDNTRYYSAVLQNDTSSNDQANNRTPYSDDDNEIKSGNTQGKVQNFKTVSLPLLNHPSNTMGTAIDANTSTTNLNDAIEIYNNGASLPTSPRKQHKRFSSILSMNNTTGPRPHRSHSTHLPKKGEFKIQDKEKEPSSSPTTTTSSTKLPKRTVKQTVKAWIHNKKKKPFSKHPHRNSNSSSLSESSSSGEFDGHEHPAPPLQHHDDSNDQQQQQKRRTEQQKQIQQYRTSSSPSSSVEAPTDHHRLSGNMRTLPHAQGENLTSMAPGHLILALVRILTALGIDVKHDSSYQLTCLRKSCHHQHHSFTKKKRNNTSKPFTALTAPIYGPPELDHGHHVEFSVEICRSLLSDLHVIDIQLTDGDALAFQFLRSKLLALLNINA